MFLRFVVATDAENAFWLTGVITIAESLRKEGELFRYESSLIEASFEWLNEHLPCPPVRTNLRSGAWTRNAVSWFRDDADEPIQRVWDIVTVLKEHGTPARLVNTDRPGKIVYSDRYQIVAETPTWA